ncbi:hypothetical protein T09_9402 [Trichinella sp. T9]|nr:hypothetical protein T09_9402 [Trichinella sp. T9]
MSNHQQHENRMLTFEHLFKLQAKRDNKREKEAFTTERMPQQQKQKWSKSKTAAAVGEDTQGERGGVQPFGYNKRRSICRSTVVSESDPRANGTRCFGLLTSADTGKAASILRSHGANALALANALTEGRSIQTN